jgi:aryl-alcohol dehydrogenase-like predicted oxidoreductase
VVPWLVLNIMMLQSVGSSEMPRQDLVLGTAQFGLAYGVAGRSSPVAELEIVQILEDAAGRGVRTLDTAPAYGDIESRLARLCSGLPFQVISKVSAVPTGASPRDAAAFVLQSAQRSRDRLGGRLRGLLLHRAPDLNGHNGSAIRDALWPWATAERVQLGVSCYGPHEWLPIGPNNGLGLVQMPGNAFDQRIRTVPPKYFEGIELHMRSVFLQGLLLVGESDGVRRVPEASKALGAWHAFCRGAGLSPCAAALGIARSFSRVNSVVVGVDGFAHWTEVADLWEKTMPVPLSEFACDSAEIIDPRLWRKSL